MINNDEFWQDFSWHDKAIAIWERIADTVQRPWGSNRCDTIY
jgi:hypothetical protein